MLDKKWRDKPVKKAPLLKEGKVSARHAVC